MTARDPDRLGTRASTVSAQVHAETYRETHLEERAAGQPTGPPLPMPRAAAGPNNLDHRRVVVGVDGSDCGRAALAWAAEEAGRRGAQLVVVGAWVPQGPMAGPMLAPGADLWADSIEATRAMLDDQISALGPDVAYRKQLVSGPAAEALEELSAEADLLVVGNHGRGAVGRVLLGSTSRHVCRHARCPVVVVPRPSPDAAPSPDPASG